MRCKRCNHLVPEGSSRCLYCGAGFPSVTETPEGREGSKKDMGEIEMEGNEKMWERSDSTESVWRTSEYWRGPGFPKDPKRAEEFLVQELMATRAKKRVPLSKTVHLILFLIAMLLGGMCVFLLS